MTDDSIMPFGTHKGKKLEDVPAQYLLWLYDQEIDGELKDYIEDNIEVLHKQAKIKFNQSKFAKG